MSEIKSLGEIKITVGDVRDYKIHVEYHFVRKNILGTVIVDLCAKDRTRRNMEELVNGPEWLVLNDVVMGLLRRN